MSRLYIDDEGNKLTSYEYACFLIRKKRNNLLSRTDWTQLPDAPLNETEKLKYIEYRQALRDIPQQEGFPSNVVFPDKLI